MAKYVTPVLVLVVAVLAVALFVRGGEVLTALAISTTNSSAATVNITNDPPVCAAVTCYDADGTTDTIDLVGGDTRFVYCQGVCNDPNGFGDMETYDGQISTEAVSGCGGADNTKCYINATCSNYSAVNSTAQNVECSYHFWYHADNTSVSGDWMGNISATDASSSVGTYNDTIDVSTLLAIGVDSTLAFGSKNADTNDSTVTTGHTLFNYGNIQMDFQVNGSTMFCDDGTISAEYLHVNLTSGDTYPAAYALTATLSGPDLATVQKFDGFNLDEPTDAGVPTATSKETYWGIGIPSSVNGNCQGTIWFAAVAS